VLIFVLTKPALVELVVIQVAPDCRRIGRFLVAGHAGRNRVSFRGRVGRTRLGPGTYRIKARSLPGGRAVLDTRLVVVTRANRRDIVAARRADVCAGPAFGGFAAWRSSVSWMPQAKEPTAASDKTEKRGASNRHGVLGTRFTWTRAGPSRWLLPLLGLGMALLAVSAIPIGAGDHHTAELLTRSRSAMALAGAGLLVGVTVAYLLP
jgi:hypothetical protein